jgi:phosphate starvation-inducible protein PhoH
MIVLDGRVSQLAQCEVCAQLPATPESINMESDVEMADEDNELVLEAPRAPPIVAHLESNPQPTSPPNVQPPQHAINLSLEQQQVLQDVREGKSVFFTGPAGTGKVSPAFYCN